MTDAQKYATVFRAAAEGVKRACWPAGVQGYQRHRDEIALFDALEGAFKAIAEVFEKIVEAEKMLNRQQGDPGYKPCPTLGPGGWCRKGGCVCSEPDSASARVEAAIQTFRKATGRYPKRVVLAPDVMTAAMAEERAKLYAEASRPGMRFVSSRRVPPGTLYCDDLEGDRL